MLYLARSLSQLHFGSLMAVYGEGNPENGREAWPEEPEMRQIQLAEEEFYRYLSQVFFKTPGAICAVWEESGRYVSALRLEPYRDGLLLEALETDPEQRRRGYSAGLIEAGAAPSGGGGGNSLPPPLAISENPRKMRLPPDCGRCRLCGRLGEPEGLHHVLGSVKTRKPPYNIGRTEVLLRATYSPRSVVFPRGSSGCSQ